MENDKCMGKTIQNGNTCLCSAITNVSRKIGWMNWLYFLRHETGIVYGMFSALDLLFFQGTVIVPQRKEEKMVLRRRAQKSRRVINI